jgi:peptide/nickel transport system permease protein
VSGARDSLLAGALRRAPAPIALAFLLALLLLAALAPVIANERPLAVGQDGRWKFPAFAALARADLLWLAGCVVAIGALLARWRRPLFVALGTAIAIWGGFFHQPKLLLPEDPPREARVIVAPVTGPKNTDLDHQYAEIGSPGHPLGTDELGRDVLARLLYGLRLSLLVGFAATAIATTIGVGIGTWAGCGGFVSDAVASWVIQLAFCLPAVFVVAAVQSLGAIELWHVVLLLALLRFGTVARLTRQECLRIRGQGFVLAARGLGLHPLSVIARHVLPNALIPVTVAAAFGVAGAIMAEAGLSFLGLGVPESYPSLGRMLSDGRRAAPLASHLVFLPGTLILVLILACHAIGAALRDVVDPRGAEATE